MRLTGYGPPGELSGDWETKTNAYTIAKRAWPEIAKQLRQSNYIQSLDNETYNKVIQWAKNKTKIVFDREQVSDVVNNKSSSFKGGLPSDAFDGDGAIIRLYRWC